MAFSLALFMSHELLLNVDQTNFLADTVLLFWWKGMQISFKQVANRIRNELAQKMP